MFEEEAEEYKDNTRIKDKNTYVGFPNERISELQDFEGNYIDISERIIKAFKDGAEFGYNKANKWHYVKDGDLPKEENLECLCIISPMKEEGEPFENKDFRGVLYYRNKRFYLDENEGDDCLQESNSDFTDLVIAWKEIVLPKESE